MLYDIIAKMNVYRRAHQLKRKIPKDYKEKLRKVVEETNSPVKICFSWFKDGFSTTLNATSVFPCAIIFNAEWMARLVLFYDEETKNSFRITVGHELTHLDGDFSKKHYHGNDRKFLSWVNEVHADFGAAQKMVGGNREFVVSGIRYKQKLKKKDHDGSYPSWKNRVYYVEKYNFSMELLEILAEQTKCHNRELIEKVHDYYGDIILK